MAMTAEDISMLSQGITAIILVIFIANCTLSMIVSFKWVL